MKKIIFFILIFSLFNISNVNSEKIEIFFKVDDEIISNIDVKNEYRYLISIKNLKNLEKKQLFEIAKNEAISDKIKEIELRNNLENYNSEDKFLNKLIEETYESLNLENLIQFEKYLKKNKLTYEFVKNKIKINFYWSRLIFTKFSHKINVNEKEIREKIIKQANKDMITRYNLSEIVFNASNEEEKINKYNKILNDIKNNNFKNAALINSISDSKNDGGSIGWVTQGQLNDAIYSVIKNLETNEISKPIRIANNFLILRLNEINQSKDDTNLEIKIKNAVMREQNFQLNQFSTIYFNKIKNNLIYNE
tara:strand:+ start:301 stop:1224 length:924 start_codon:yes stop_codon:yes gene_type:complete